MATAKRQYGFETPMPFEPDFDYSYDGVMKSWESSLQRLGLSRIDMLYMHDIGRLTHGDQHKERMEEAKGGFRALEQLKSQGLIDRVGIGVNEVDVCLDVLAMADIDTILLAGQYNLLQQDAAKPLFRACADRNVSIVGAGVYASGILASGVKTAATPYFNYAPAPPPVVHRVEQLESLCEEFSVSLATVALQFVMRQPAVESVLLGMTGRQRVEKNLASASELVPSALWSELEERNLLTTVAA
jgi:D-threo-aldose 1-dehydrogenase